MSFMYSFTVSLTDNCDDNKDADNNDADGKGGSAQSECERGEEKTK